tara:strand:+ start:18 stop:911 length:894 start_codon:yes stop_codon:yes gene_type:complete
MKSKIISKIKLIFYKLFKKFFKVIFKKNYPKEINFLLTKLEYKEFFLERENFQSKIISSYSDIDWIIKRLENQGYCVIKEFWSEDECFKTIKVIDDLILRYPNFVHSNNKSDSRIYGAENISKLINNFSKNELLLSVAEEYNKKNTSLGFTLAAKMPAIKNNKGSGEGWHRDGFFRQFKTLLYLSDVGKNNGPFELIENSHKFEYLIEDIKKGKLEYSQFRLTDSEIKKILIDQTERKKTIIGKMGTLILIDTSSLHRGSPIKDSTRYALTNYYYTSNQIDSELYKKFNVVPKKIFR